MRVALRLLVAAAVLMVVAGALTAVVVLRPAQDEPGRADAVVVLSGDHGERLARAKELLAAGLAPTLVLVGAPDRLENLELCAGPSTYDVVCLRPEPDSTRTEAAATAQLARERNWRSIVVVTSKPHVTRARLLFDRCFPGSLDVVGADLPFGGAQARAVMIHEWLGLFYAAVPRGC